jgi:GNAT superfamily N-acetyltransferase
MAITFIDAWGKIDPQHAVQAMRFWKAIGISLAQQQERLSEICAFAYVDGTFAGVSTARLQHYPMLRARMAYYRCAVVPEFRRRDISYRLSGHSRRLLEKWSRAHPEERVMGLAAEIEAREYLGKQLEPTWPEHGLDLNLAYYLPSGRQLRVAWFKHARLEPDS